LPRAARLALRFRGHRVSDHHDGRRFFNPTGPTPLRFSAVPRLLLERRAAWPRRIDVSLQPTPPVDDADAVVTFIGHATFLIQTQAGNLLTDPMYSRRAGPFNLLGPQRVREPAIRLEDLPHISAVLLSHNHYDHCDVPTLRRLAKRFDPRVITPLGNARLVRSAGIRQVQELDWWQQSSMGNLTITLTRAHHFSARTPLDRNRALWGGFMIGAGGVRIFFAGDTAYVDFFRGIRQRLGPIDLALLPIGAYEPRWFMHAAHMNPAEAVQAHLDLEASQSIAMHFGTFQLTTEGVDDPVRALAEACDARNVPSSQFRVLQFGESVRLRA
jgi:L-ascorbate metabolism protein UlaG (beta-lactamase superfamily)